MRRSLLGILVAATALQCGCATLIPTRGEPGPSYPDQLERGRTLNIQVFQENDRQTIVFTNTTPRAFDSFRLWLNGWFSHEVDGMQVGETIRLPVRSFVDEHGKLMRGGGFFATKAPDPLLLAEIETENELLRLVVVEEPQQ